MSRVRTVWSIAQGVAKWVTGNFVKIFWELRQECHRQRFFGHGDLRVATATAAMSKVNRKQVVKEVPRGGGEMRCVIADDVFWKINDMLTKDPLDVSRAALSVNICAMRE